MKYVKPLELIRHVLKKSNPVKRCRVLGLDVGDELVGFAHSDVHNEIAEFSYVVRSKVDIDLIASDVQSMISDHSVEGLVIGYPLDTIPENSGYDHGVHVTRFINDLNEIKQLQELKYSIWDNYWALKAVDGDELVKVLPQAEQKKKLPILSAFHTLQSYLDSVNKETQVCKQRSAGPQA